MNLLLWGIYTTAESFAYQLTLSISIGFVAVDLFVVCCLSVAVGLLKYTYSEGCEAMFTVMW
jgi:hypothetical protein